MLHEFDGAVEQLQTIVELVIGISNNTGVDEIDFTVLDIPPAELEPLCFAPTGLQTPLGSLTLKEAYDNLRVLARLATVYTHDRAYYYTTNAAEYTKYAEQITYLLSILTQWQELGAPEDA